MLLSDTLQKIKSSPTTAIFSLAKEMKAQGIDVISLSAGEPDFDTPEHICKAAFDAMQQGKTRYTPVDGTPELKEAVSHKFKCENHLDYSLEEISVGSGGKQLIYNAMLASLNPGDEVVIPAPYWVSYPDIVKLGGASPIIIETSPRSGFKITADQLETAITTKTKWLLLNSPSNPTGAVYTENELRALGEVLLNHTHVHILCDDIYEHIVFDGVSFKTLPQVVPALKERCLVVNGVSKAFAMTGWRLGYAAGPKDLISAMRKLQSQSTSCPSSISQYAALAALTGPQDFLKTWQKSFQDRRDMVVEHLNQIEGIDCLKPQGAFYVYPEISKLIGRVTPNGTPLKTDEDFVYELLNTEKLATVFGGAFGLSPYFRISYAASKKELELACQKIQHFVSELS